MTSELLQELSKGQEPAEDPFDELVELLELLQDECRYGFENRWSWEQMQRLFGFIHMDLGFAIDQVLALKHFG